MTKLKNQSKDTLMFNKHTVWKFQKIFGNLHPNIEMERKQV